MVRRFVPELRESERLDFVVANYENASHGFGLTEKNAKELLSAGVDAMTGGNHTWDKKEIRGLLESLPLLRPGFSSSILPATITRTVLITAAAKVTAMYSRPACWTRGTIMAKVTGK